LSLIRQSLVYAGVEEDGTLEFPVCSVSS